MAEEQSPHDENFDSAEIDCSFWKEEVTPELSKQKTRILLRFILKHIGVIAWLLSGATILLCFIIYAYQIGRGLYFGVDISEVPYEQNLFGFFIYFIAASVLVFSNSLSYKSFSDEKRALGYVTHVIKYIIYATTLFSIYVTFQVAVNLCELVSRSAWFVLPSLIVCVVFLRTEYKKSSECRFCARFSSCAIAFIVQYVILFFIYSELVPLILEVIFCVFCIFLLAYGISPIYLFTRYLGDKVDKRIASKETWATDNSNDESSEKKKEGNIKEEVYGKRIIRYLCIGAISLCISTFTGMWLGFSQANFLQPSNIALEAFDGKVTDYEHFPDGEINYIVFSSDDAFCVKRGMKEESKITLRKDGPYKWISKEDVWLVPIGVNATIACD